MLSIFRNTDSMRKTITFSKIIFMCSGHSLTGSDGFRDHEGAFVSLISQQICCLSHFIQICVWYESKSVQSHIKMAFVTF